MSKDEYLITDPPLKALTVFAMPMILGSFFQQVYNMADSNISAGVCNPLIMKWEKQKPKTPRTTLRIKKLIRDVDTMVFILP